MQNKYAKACEKCQGIVAPYKGVLEKRGDRWIVEHVECHYPTATERTEVAQPLNHPAFVPMDAFDWMEADFEQGTF